MPARPPLADETRRAALRHELGLTGVDDAHAVDTLLDHALRLDAERTCMADFARASGDWMWEVDASLQLTWLSASFVESTGAAPMHHIGLNLADTELLDPAAMPAFRATLAAHAPFSRVVVLMHTAHGTLKVSHSAVPTFDFEQRFTGYRGTARDVTAQVDAETQARAQAELLRQSEARWDLAARATGIGIAAVELPSGRMHLDERACINHGLAYPAVGYDYTTWLASICPHDRAGAQAAVQEAIDTCGRLEARYHVQLPDGSQRLIEIVAQATVGTDGRATGIVGTCRNVTEQVAHEQLLRDKEAAERANRAKSEFLSRVSHELRTPLNSILGFAQLMGLDRVHPLAPAQQRRLDSVQRAGRHLLDLINDVLDLARIEHEDFSLRLEPVDLSVALDASLSLILPLARECDVDLPPPPAAACWVRADARALEQVLMNLLSNAIKYNRAGGRVGVKLRRADGLAHLSISDEGPGLSSAQQARLFQHFERLGAEGGNVQGSGLGLLISQELAHAMGAKLQVYSVPGAGSTFTLVLNTEQAPPAPPPAPAAEPPADGDASDRPRRVLYIEDERLNVVLMEEMFRTRPQWALSIAEDGAEGLQLARELRPNLLLIDMNLPDTTGLELIRALRADPNTAALRCIALSADAMSEQIEAAMAAGFDEYWTKPIDVQRVLTDLARCLD